MESIRLQSEWAVSRSRPTSGFSMVQPGEELRTEMVGSETELEELKNADHRNGPNDEGSGFEPVELCMT